MVVSSGVVSSPSLPFPSLPFSNWFLRVFIPSFFCLQVDQDDQTDDHGDEHDGGYDHGEVEYSILHEERARRVLSVHNRVVVDTEHEHHDEKDGLDQYPNIKKFT